MFEKILNTLIALRRTIGGVKRKFLYWQLEGQFAKIHKSSSIIKPLLITPEFIELGENVSIWNNARIQGVKKYNEVEFFPRIVFCDGVSVQQNLHLTSAKRIIIGKNTAIAANVTITDILHPYDDIEKPIESQDIRVCEVEIGEDCKIFNNAVILPGVHIGNHVVVGANSVVTHSIPNYCIAVGSPARVVKRYDFEQRMWKKIDTCGNLIGERDVNVEQPHHS